MEKIPSNKVYINPNFKGTSLVHKWPFIDRNNTKLHKYVSHQPQNDKSTIEKECENSSRKIYINPNFTQVKQEKDFLSSAQVRHEKIKGLEDYETLISKSKISLGVNINKCEVNERHNYRKNQPIDNSKSLMNKRDVNKQNICTQEVLNDKYLQAVPVIKSRYSIIRKNKVLCENKKEIKQRNLKDQLNLLLLKNQENNNLNDKPLQNIPKIKISRYKTIPMSYLKNNPSSTKNNQYEPTTSVSQSYTNTDKFNRFEFSLLQTYNRNRYKLTRPSSKAITNISKDNFSKMNSQTVKKSVWHNEIKIKLFKANFKMNNIPCRLFTKYGKCLRKEYGKCEYLHDKKHVSLCRKFLKGICHDRNCSLSHELTANKMPTCYFFLKGICTKENCPYLHIKLNDRIKICQNFLRGYCENGDKCIYRHVKVNQFKKSKTFNSNSSYLKSKSIKLKKAKTKSSIQKKNITQSNDKNNINSQNKENSDIDCRYYKDMVTNESSCKNIKPSRCKLGTLPSFIQL